MASFEGFPTGKVRMTPIPAQFFAELLPVVDHLGELKVILYAIWKLDRIEGDLRSLRRSDFAGDERLMQGLSDHPAQVEASLDEALERAVGRGALLMAEVPSVEIPSAQEQEVERVYFLNSPRGRAALEAVQKGTWRPEKNNTLTPNLGEERPNIFRLYEENIGPLTPIIADLLRDSEVTYSAAWIEEAVSIAVQRGIRNWRYVEAVLRRWKEKGRDEQDRRDTEKDGDWYLEDDYAQFIEH
jgi:DNA replication protein